MDQESYQQAYQQGLSQAQQKNYLAAVGAFTEAIAANAWGADAYYQRGLAYFDLGQAHPAISDYTQALTLQPDHSLAAYGRALARLSLKNLPGAWDDIEVAIRVDPKSPGAHQLRGTILRKQGNLPEAVNSFKQAAQLYLEQQDKQGCRRCLEQVTALTPQPVEQERLSRSAPSQRAAFLEADFFKQLLVRAERGDFRGAMEELAWAIQVDPTDAKAYYCRGMLHCKQQHYRQAIADFNQALHCISPGESSPDVGSIFRNRGKARIQLGDYLGAITDFEQALKQDPQDAAVYVARGNAYRLSGKYVEAIQDYSQALKINPKDALAYYNRAIAQVCIEETQQASEDYQRAASQFCEQEDWENYQKALDSLKKLQKAMPRARPEDLTALLRQRLLRLVGGHWEIAERLIQQLKQKRPGMAEEWYLDRVIQQIQRDGR